MTDKTELRILQYNVHKRLDAVQVPFIRDDQVKQFDIVAIQEQGRAVKAAETYNASSNKFHLVNNASINSRACLYINKAIDKNSWRVERSEPDICTIRIETNSETGIKKAIFIHSVYNPCPLSQSSTEGPSTLPLLQQALSVEGDHIYSVTSTCTTLTGLAQEVSRGMQLRTNS